jgi:hypothetical protein
VLCKDKQIKVMVIGGSCNYGTLNDCWLLDVDSGTGERLMSSCKALKRMAHSANTITLPDGTVLVVVFGGYYHYDDVDNRIKRSYGNLSYFRWDPSNPGVLDWSLIGL